MHRGAEFGEVEPKDTEGRIRNTFFSLPATARGLEHGVITPVVPRNSFRIGQQVFFWVGVNNSIQNGGVIGAENFITTLRLKLWWARPNLEYRNPGDPNFGGYTGLDTQTFLPGPNSNDVNNRYVWIPSPKRLDVTEFQPQTPAPQPIAAEACTSDSLLLDDVWRFCLQDADAQAYIDDFPAPQVISRWVSIMYPAHGYQLGFTWDATFNVAPGSGSPPAFLPLPFLSVTYKLGTLGGTLIQESIG